MRKFRKFLKPHFLYLFLSCGLVSIPINATNYDKNYEDQKNIENVQQNNTIKGTILDEEGIPLIGVSVK